MKFRHVVAGLAALTTAVSGAVITTVSSAGASTASAAPVKIAWLGFETGVYAQPTRHNDINLAIKQINAAGGVDGHMFEYTPYDTGFTPATAVTGTQQALAGDPTAILGYSVDDQIQATASLLRQSGVPVLSFSEGPAALSTVNHIPNLFTVPTDGPVSSVTANMTYAVKADHPKTAGIFVTDDTASDADASVAKAVLEKDGVKNVTIETASDTATDATTQALALKNDDLIFQDGFPTVLAVFDNELRQNGYNGPIADGQSGDFLSAFGLVKQNVFENYQYTPYCAADVLKTAKAKAYVSAYEAAYPTDIMRTATPYAYDAVMILAAAIKANGGSLNSAKLVKTIDTMTYDGVCGTYHADAVHELLHQITVISLKNGATDPTLLGTYQEPVLTKAQIKEYSGA